MAKVPWGALFFGTVGGAAAFRALYRPARAVVRNGYVTRCAGDGGCDPHMAIQSAEGIAPVYAVTSGRVLEVKELGAKAQGARHVRIASSREPVVLCYELGSQSMVHLQPGQKIGMGEEIAKADTVGFGVERYVRKTDGSIEVLHIEPASWLASRGLGVSVKKRKAEQQWCEQGRRLVVPERSLQCGLELPEPPRATLLPVSVTTG